MPVQQGFAPLVENPQFADFQVLQLYKTIASFYQESV